jgi:hypothetical protein
VPDYERLKAAIEDGRIRGYRDARYSNYKTLSEACAEPGRSEDNIHLIRHTRMTPLYAGGWMGEGGGRSRGAREQGSGGESPLHPSTSAPLPRKGREGGGRGVATAF